VEAPKFGKSEKMSYALQTRREGVCNKVWT
jgi:hypothetical protein